MWFRLAFGIAFAFAVVVAARTARVASRRHGGSLNQLSHEVRGLLFVRAALGIVFYSALMAWLFWPRGLSWMYLPVPLALRWMALGLLIPSLSLFAASFHALGSTTEAA